MSLAPGTRIGPYEILGAIGAGGMGEVCRARDTKLDREVAIKILPAEFARDPERLARFTREAKVLAALNHPNIAQIYGLEESNEGPALVMELIQGDTIRGPLPEQQALEYARQIAAALEAAHEKGIVHRDLKPANIMRTADGVIKVLDFGIASVAQPPNFDPANSPTLTLAATSMGVIMGTAGYMSPEQASGKPVDKRADIFSFGVVLYELITGKRLFDGETVSHTLAAVLTVNPDLSNIPTTARTLIQRCLEKDPKRRLRDIGDAFLVEPVLPSATTSGYPRWLLPPAVAAVLSAGAIGWFLRPIPKAPELPVRVFTIPAQGTLMVGAETMYESNAAISPNGKMIAFVASNQLWLRDLAVEQPRAVEGTNRAHTLFWAPDSKRIGFLQGSELKAVPVDGGPPVLLATLDGRIRAAAWSPDGSTIVVGGSQGRLFRIHAAGGTVSRVNTQIPITESYLSLHFMPASKGKNLVLTSRGIGNTASQMMAIVDLDAGSLRNLGRGNYPVYAGDGSIIYQSEIGLGPVRMQKLSPDTLEPEGESVHLLSAGWRPTVSEEGTMLWMDPAFDQNQNRQLVWRDRAGTRIAAIGEPQQYLQSVELSPDGGRAVYSATASINRDIWALDLARSVQSRFTTDAEFDGAPVWSPNGKEIAFRSSRSGAGDIYVQPADGSAPARLVLGSPEADFPRSWSPDGTTILFTRQSNSSSQDVWSITRKPDGTFGEPAPFLQSKGNENAAGFSPDGRYVVYASDESGRTEVYVRAFPAGGERVQISTSGGTYPRWSRNATEIFFLSGESMMAVPVTMQPVLRAGALVELFKQPGLVGVFAPFDVTADGKRFLISEAGEGSAGKSLSLHVIQNWRAMARQ